MKPALGAVRKILDGLYLAGGALGALFVSPAGAVPSVRWCADGGVPAPSSSITPPSGITMAAATTVSSIRLLLMVSGQQRVVPALMKA